MDEVENKISTSDIDNDLNYFSSILIVKFISMQDISEDEVKGYLSNLSGISDRFLYCLNYFGKYRPNATYHFDDWITYINRVINSIASACEYIFADDDEKDIIVYGIAFRTFDLSVSPLSEMPEVVEHCDKLSKYAIVSDAQYFSMYYISLNLLTHYTKDIHTNMSKAIEVMKVLTDARTRYNVIMQSLEVK